VAPFGEALASPPPSLDKDSPVPLYQQLREQLETWGRDKFGTDRPLPIERDLGRMFGVSRITVRQALALLVSDGSAYRPRSRGRLFLSKLTVHQHLTRLRGFFTDDVLAAGLNSRTTVRSVGLSDDHRAKSLLLLGPSDLAVRVDRTHEAGGMPVALQTSYFPNRHFADLLGGRYDLTASLLRLIEETFGRRVTRATEHIRARHPHPDERTLLKLGRSTCVVEVERVSFAADVPVEYFICCLPADLYDFSIELDATTNSRLGGQNNPSEHGTLQYGHPS
jgi:GntR family transcriptional regulator